MRRVGPDSRGRVGRGRVGIGRSVATVALCRHDLYSIYLMFGMVAPCATRLATRLESRKVRVALFRQNHPQCAVFTRQTHQLIYFMHKNSALSLSIGIARTFSHATPPVAGGRGTPQHARRDGPRLDASRRRGRDVNRRWLQSSDNRTSNERTISNVLQFVHGANSFAD